MEPSTLPSQDVGLGTAYERVAVYRLLDRWTLRRQVATAFEGPVDGMAGIPGLHLLGLARRGTRVTVALPDPAALDLVRDVYRLHGAAERLRTLRADPDAELPAQRFDLVLTYNATPLVADWQAYLSRLAPLAARWLVVSVTNPASYGVAIRKLQRLLEPKAPAELFDHESIRPAALEPLLARFGRTVEHEYLDCPWWPDLFVPTGQTLLGATLERLPGLSRLAARLRRAPADDHGARFLYGRDRFPLFPDAPEWDELGRALERHPVFDQRGTMLGRLFGHHHAYLIEISE
ncbi:MAG TPA: hypothetical protein VKN99_23860 [Polyangia bacterium]|nr:hypothetical protein [Polyangia bacterium]